MNTYRTLLNHIGHKRGVKLKPNTYAMRDEGQRCVRILLHGNEILTYREDGTVAVSTTGWATDLTRNRLNDFGPPGVLFARRGGEMGFYKDGNPWTPLKDGQTFWAVG